MSVNKVLSGEYINSCCNGKCGDGCNGGHPEKAWKYIKKNGLCTGGEYGSNEVGVTCNKVFNFCVNIKQKLIFFLNRENRHTNRTYRSLYLTNNLTSPFRIQKCV